MSSVRPARRMPLRTRLTRSLRRRGAYVATLLGIELLDELVDGARAVAWPFIRADLDLGYTQVGLLQTVPDIVATVVEPVLGVAGDVGNRRAIVRGGGIAFACAALLIATSTTFFSLLLAFALFYPASGAFVTLSQATLIDLDPRREEKAMARWVVAGSLGQLLGAPLVAAAAGSGLGWRGAFAAIGVLAVGMLAGAWRWPFRAPQGDAWGRGPARAMRDGTREAFAALRRPTVLRWLLLLEACDLLLDILHGFLALYLVDVAGETPARAALLVAVWAGAGIVGDVLLLPLLERVDGLRALRVSAAASLAVYAAFLLSAGQVVQLPLIALLGVLHAGWYAILAARLYAALPGRSATVNTVGSIVGVAGTLIPVALGALAERFGLATAMWTLMLGPLALLVGLRREERDREPRV